MTELILQRDIINELKELIKDWTDLFDKDELKIHRQDLPVYPATEEDEEKLFPCLVVSIAQTLQSGLGAHSNTMVEITAVIKDWDEEGRGFETLMVVLERLRSYFTSQPGIRKKHRLLAPLNTRVNTEAALPYYVGTIETHWATASAPYEDIEQFL